MKLENPQEYIGKKYGSIVILSYYGRYSNGYGFICKCNCGNEFIAKMYQKDKIRNYCDTCYYKIVSDKSAKSRTRWFTYDGEIYSTKTYAEKFGIRKRKGD